MQTRILAFIVEQESMNLSIETLRKMYTTLRKYVLFILSRWLHTFSSLIVYVLSFYLPNGHGNKGFTIRYESDLLYLFPMDNELFKKTTKNVNTLMGCILKLGSTVSQTKYCVFNKNVPDLKNLILAVGRAPHIEFNVIHYRI
ncbi:hypothetical protein ACJX0J_030870 [Zea mays]